ncbi:hypothetical protein SMACR_05146 [Sordaria macrospora]|uniref:WGS project CABT00000000 data, contig 2.22 n=2 Tax=Sordaria macrospora TaxID=5147 RepID=F7W2T2_SORMK|nr:uncharacterized protein SMAC_05146 [Sordaria macrospora k-hell]KAA8631831.1 hypothetical protein SMACR_05146 [Sordaria macrospora]WPJ61038.1 hypothetical protein SMAC4_05146 [Sordaria macrospora]CCC11933.1 unnamed protein product [Sordaria macrospora k-hell]
MRGITSHSDYPLKDTLKPLVREMFMPSRETPSFKAQKQAADTTSTSKATASHQSSDEEDDFTQDVTALDKLKQHEAHNYLNKHNKTTATETIAIFLRHLSVESP